MALRIVETSQSILNMWARIPFRFGITTMTAMPHLFLQVVLEIDGRRESGVAADHLPPKWFTKNPDTTYTADVTEMLQVIDTACDVARAAPKADTLFDLWFSIYQGMAAWGGGWGKPPLLTHFGTSLVERALIDAFCRAEGTTFPQAAARNWFGVDLGRMHEELERAQPRDLLPPTPLKSVVARHTVGLSDPLTEADIAPADLAADALPQSLEASIRAYGLTHFKIKLCGDVAKDLARLRGVAAVVSRETRQCVLTLDGNENFKQVEPFEALWAQLKSEPALREFLERVLFVEQPFHRGVALSDEVAKDLAAWTDRPAIIIDESDAELADARRALGCGYAGTSHKNCKGVFKGLATACLMEHHRRTQPGRLFIHSGEDLSNVGPVSLPQDLAAMATFGIDHVERNGHHYFRGLSMLPDDLRQASLAAHPDLYRRTNDDVTLRIENGRLNLGSVLAAPFGRGVEFDPRRFTLVKEWEFASLGLS